MIVHSGSSGRHRPVCGRTPNDGAITRPLFPSRRADATCAAHTEKVEFVMIRSFAPATAQKSSIGREQGSLNTTS